MQQQRLIVNSNHNTDMLTPSNNLEFNKGVSLCFPRLLGKMPFLSWSIMQSLIKLLPGLHLFNLVFLGACCLEVLEECLNSFHGHPKSGYWVNHAIIAHLREILDVDDGRLTELSHISQQID